MPENFDIAARMAAFNRRRSAETQRKTITRRIPSRDGLVRFADIPVPDGYDEDAERTRKLVAMIRRNL